MIRIEGLTRYQVEMLDHMWSLKTQQEYEDWLSLLDAEDYATAKNLAYLIALECLEPTLDPDFTDAKNILQKFAL